MARLVRKPELDDAISIEYIALDTKLFGTVIQLLDTQFIIRVNKPEMYASGQFFIKYKDPWLPN